MASAVAVLAMLLDGLGASAGLMLSLMKQHAPAQSTGLPAEDYPAMATMITGYLSGTNDTFQYTIVTEEGEEQTCFHDYEQAHMADCRGLFVLDRQVLLVALTTACGAAAGVLALRKRKRAAAWGFLVGNGLVMAAVLTLIVWGAADFDGLFVLFHQLSFSNGLWLLNPQTDLLIRLMPTAFFLHYAAILGGTWLGLTALGEVSAALLLRRWRHMQRSNR